MDWTGLELLSVFYGFVLFYKLFFNYYKSVTSNMDSIYYDTPLAYRNHLSIWSSGVWFLQYNFTSERGHHIYNNKIIPKLASPSVSIFKGSTLSIIVLDH